MAYSEKQTSITAIALKPPKTDHLKKRNDECESGQQQSGDKPEPGRCRLCRSGS